MKRNVLVVFGTRPEAIKMAPVITELKTTFDVRICVSSQHRKMLDQVLQEFKIEPDDDLNVMVDNQDLSDTSANVLIGMRDVLERANPDIVLVQGDTTTTVTAALAAFYQRVKVGHVEAGLRTHDLSSPFPEELNRQLVSRIANLHFAPTDEARGNLLREGISSESIYVTGNTVIDALKDRISKARETMFPREIVKQIPLLEGGQKSGRKFILVTGHRRENFGVGLEEICNAVRTLASENPSIAIVYPVHLNPNVREPVMRILSPVENIYLTEPLEYLTFIKLLDLAYLVLTDSGGVQEEAPSLGKPVLVMRDKTERPEGLEAGTVSLVGVTEKSIVKGVMRLLTNSAEYKSMSRAHNPYGDGYASKRIKAALLEAEI